MDLQSILDASDSSDGEDHQCYGVSGGVDESFLSRYTTGTLESLDIEHILRESDNDDEVNDEQRNYYGDAILDGSQKLRVRSSGQSRNTTVEEILSLEIGSTKGNHHNHQHHRHNLNSIDKSLVNDLEDDDVDDLALGGGERHRNGHHSATDWAILQTILMGDDDEDADEDETDHNDDDYWLNNSLDPNLSLAALADNTGLDVRLAPHWVEDDENPEMGSGTPKPLTTVAQQPDTILTVPSHETCNSTISDTLDAKGSLLHNLDMYDKAVPDAMTSGRNIMPQIIKDQTDDLKEEELSKRALNYAHTQEQKILKAGHRDLVSPLRVKRRLKQKIELVPRGHKTKNHASKISSLSVTRFGSSGIVENKTLTGASSSLEKHANDDAKVPCGLPTCLAFNSKFIAIGTQRGIILIYDLFEVLRQRLGATYEDGNESALRAGSITSLDLSYNGEAVIAGHSSGTVVLWDTIRGLVLRAVNEVHLSPVSSVRFLTGLKVVTVDVVGLVNKLSFAKNILWQNYSLETECLLDGTAGQILAMNVLPSFSTVKPQLRPQTLTPWLKKLSLVALSSERSSFVVAVEPQVHVLHRWTRPPADRTDVIVPEGADDPLAHECFLPCLSWGWGLVAGGGNKVMPILARAWGCCLQLLVASFPSAPEESIPISETSQQAHWPAFGLHKEIDAEKPIVAIEWLDDRSLMYLTLTNEFTLIDTVMMTLLERLDFSGLRLVYAEFTLSRSAAHAEKGTSAATTFQNSIRYSDDRLMVLCRHELRCISVVGARKRIASLEEDGEWLEALALALDYYESAVVSQEDRKRDPSGKKDLSRHPDFNRAKFEEEEWLSKLLIRYLNLAVENAPENSTSTPYSRDSAQAGTSLVHSHFQMLAGVCIEYCVVTRKAELLFGPIFQKFQAAGFTSVFLDVLEPYVLNDMLPYIGAEAMSFFVDHCKATNSLATVERCLLHMDCSIMDFDTILGLLRRNAMYTALFYVYNNGLNDYITPLEILLEKLVQDFDSGRASRKRRSESGLRNDFDRLGYKAILYLKTLFLGKSFPREEDIRPETMKQTIRCDLLRFLLRKSSSETASSRQSQTVRTKLSYPNLHILLMVDARAILNAIIIALDQREDQFQPTDDWIQNEMRNKSLPMPQDFVDVLCSILRPEVSAFDASSSVVGKSSFNAFLDFTAKYVMNGTISVNRNITFMIINRMANVFRVKVEPECRQKAQNQVMTLLSALPRESYEPDDVLHVIRKAGMHRAALLLHQQVASPQNEAVDDIELRAKHFQSAIDCYIEDDNPEFRTEVYAYVKKVCSGVVNRTENLHHRPTTLRDALFVKLTLLCRLSPRMTASLVADLLIDDLDHVVIALDGSDEEQFNFLHVIASGELANIDPVAGSILILNVDHYQTYLSLMAKLHPEMVYEYLSTHDNYRTEECLTLCEKHDIPDATVYLLERTDQINEALRLGLQTLESRMMELKRAVRSMEIESLRKDYILRRDGEGSKLPNKQSRALDSLKRMLTVVLDVCERKSSAHGSKLWFTVLDRLIAAKGFLRLSKEQPQHAKIMADVLSDLLRTTMQRMVSNVPLSDLVSKVTSHNAGSNLGELREMVESLLGTYNYELKVFEGATAVFHHEIHSAKREHRVLCMQGSFVDVVANHSLRAETTPSLDNLLRGHPNSTLLISTGHTASLVQGDSQVYYSQLAETGLANALNRLRARRESKQIGRSSTLNLMTSVEHDYENGETDPVVFDPRPVGALGHAEHRGRIMTFR